MGPGIGDWGLRIGDWGLKKRNSPILNPQSPISNPQSPISKARLPVMLHFGLTIINGNVMSARFAILHHVNYEIEHWDLMLEHEGVLLTWKLPLEPIDRSMFPMPACRIKDHRVMYLDYQGPISGDRGEVTRVDGGLVVIERLSERECVCRLSEGRLAGRFHLLWTGEGPQDWLLEVLPTTPVPT